MEEIIKVCKNCSNCVPCKTTVENKWVWFHICKALTDGRDGFAVVVNPEWNCCEEFSVKEQTDQPKRGKWIYNGRYCPAECSSCHAEYKIFDEFCYEMNFCPLCGADMREERKDD